MAIESNRFGAGRRPADGQTTLRWHQVLQSPEFWDWAYAHGYPPRGPIGSDQNMARMLQLSLYVKDYIRAEGEKHPNGNTDHAPEPRL